MLRTLAAALTVLMLIAAPLGAADLITGLGDPPVGTTGYYVGGFGENAFPHSLDDSVTVNISSVFPGGLRFGGGTHTTMYINGHGNVTFEQADGGNMVPDEIQAGASFPRIAPFFADTDTRPNQSLQSPGGTSKGSNRIYWDLDADNGIITVTWDDVGYYSNKTNKVNAYQLRLIRVGNAGEFDIEFRYEWINWTNGDQSAFQDGTNGLAVTDLAKQRIARAGYTAADGANFYELPQSGKQGTESTLTIDPPGADLATAGGMLDLAQLSNVGQPGIFKFFIRRPVVTITPANGTWTNASPIVFTITFDQSVSGFAIGDLSLPLGNGTLGALTTVTAGRVYTVPVTPTADGPVQLLVAEDAVSSSAGLGNAATSVTVNSDRTPPSVTSIAPTGGTEVHTIDVPFTVTFSEPMINVAATDFVSTNGSAIAISGTGATRTVTIRTVTEGALNLTLPAASCTDRAGNTLVADGTANVTVDTSGATVNVTHPVASGRTNALAPVLFTITFSDPVTGFAASEVSVANGTRAADFASQTPTVYTLEVTPAGDGVVGLTVPARVAVDADGLGNFAGSNGFIVDRVAPTATVTAPAGPITDGNATFLVTFSEAMGTFVAGDVTVANGSLVGAPVLVPGTTATYRVTVNATGGGNVQVTIDPTSTDLAGNTLAAAVSATVTYQGGLAPLAITTAAAQPTTTAPIPVTFTFGGVADGFTALDVGVANGSRGALVDAGGGVYTMDVTPAGAGLVTVSVPANACTVGGLGNEAASLVVNHEPNGPRPRFSIAPIRYATIGQQVWLTITFDEDVAGLAAGDLVITNGSVVSWTAVSPRVYKALIEIDYRPNTQGLVTVPAGAATASGRQTAAASINLLSPAVVAGAQEKKHLCGLGTGYAVACLVLMLIAGLQAAPGAVRRR